MKLSESTYAVVLAGGSGTRLWPKSTKNIPKQFQTAGKSGRSMLEQTLLRMEGFVPKNRRIVVTSDHQFELASKLAGSLCGKILAEPKPRGTAAALALAASYIRSICSEKCDPVMVCWHADQWIKLDAGFWQSQKQAIALAKSGKLALVGLRPTRPETGFGYIEKGLQYKGLSSFEVKSFKEKPSHEGAEKYIKNGYLWNTGIFVWSVQVFWRELASWLPLIADTLSDVEFCKKKYANLENISIDKGLLEKSKSAAVVEASFKWGDMGTYKAYKDLYRADLNGDIVLGEAFMQGTKNNIVDVDRFAAIVGVEGLTIVSTDKALLVCKTEEAQRVKEVVEHLEATNRQDLL